MTPYEKARNEAAYKHSEDDCYCDCGNTQTDSDDSFKAGADWSREFHKEQVKGLVEFAKFVANDSNHYTLEDLNNMAKAALAEFERLK